MSPRSVWRVTVFKSLGKLVLSTVLVGVLIALGIAPIAGVGGVAVARTNETMQSDLQDLTNGDAPGVSTILDAKGNPIPVEVDGKQVCKEREVAAGSSSSANKWADDTRDELSIGAVVIAAVLAVPLPRQPPWRALGRRPRARSLRC